ncbi:hypothetical protein [Pseudomonas japonica]|uniref:hypothetical protein n=1 Tax=Pseudomonas japonica TaxID=256466 RepID=UPI0015E30D6D|nr:hypothetical protein [Pseudomonas japonica]MBA1245711.1 hypothetical protein [Pseudomonas japonica]
MTIIKNTSSLKYYPFRRLPPAVRLLMEQCSAVITTGGFRCLMKLFEAYCHVTSTAVSYLGISDKSFGSVCVGFIGSFSGQCLIDQSQQTRRRYAVNFIKLLHEMQKHLPLCPTYEQSPQFLEKCASVWEQQKQGLDLHAVRYWNGWTITDPKGGNIILALPQIWHSHGSEFAEQFYKYYNQLHEKKIRNDNVEINHFLDYLAENSAEYPVETFGCPIRINNLFNSYLWESWHRSTRARTEHESKSKVYSRFINSITESFLDTGVWAKPFRGALSKVPMTAKCGSRTKVVKNEDGREVKNNLITQIPLTLTDSEAITILFKKIKLDNALVFKWARSRCMKLRKAQLRRIRLSKIGTVISENRPSAQSIADIGAEHICASFEAHGLPFFRNDYQKRFGTIQKSEISNELGLPNKYDLIALLLMLIRSHPVMTESFFKDFELYDKNGNLSGLLKTNSGYQLIGYKDRKGGKLSEQKIDLSARDAAVVRMLIELTEPLRKELREAGFDAWRYLLIHCSRSINKPNRPNTKRWGANTAKETMEEIVAEFSRHSALGDVELRHLVNRVSIASYRPSVAVEDYLRHNSVRKLARDLGHETFRPNLLSSYLPQVILDFFQTRWIRIFQKGVILEAMKNSPYLLEASGFENMDELHEFLSNHALKELPQRLKLPRNQGKNLTKHNSNKSEERVLISISTPLMTSLVSLRDAVSSASKPDQVHAKAKYWAAFTMLVSTHIREGFDEVLLESLTVAESRTDPESMLKFIYESAA